MFVPLSPKKSERDNEIQETRGKMQRRESKEDYKEEEETVEVEGIQGSQRARGGSHKERE